METPQRWLPMPDIDAVPDDAESDAPLPAVIIDALRTYVVPERAYVPGVPSVIAEPERFRVRRTHQGVTYESYAGANGGDARRAWEAYETSDLPGDFTLYDGEHCRGRFSRAPEGHS
jgi:hypothetical protein